MCTWIVTAVVEYFNMRGRTVYGTAMDCSKAFDMVRWTELFKELRKKGLSPIFLRLLLFTYFHQYCDVRWNGSFSYRFPVCNGVRQGAVSSPIFFSVYVDKLIQHLRLSGIGCTIGGIFVGIVVYADDIFLLCPSRAGLQSMVNICEKFANKHNLQFSTNPDPNKSKTKGMIFTKNQRHRVNVPPVLLNGLPLPWVERMKHLGNTLECENNMVLDIGLKRAKFIGKIHSLNQELHFCSPEVLIKLKNIYCCSFYGSNLFHLFSNTLDSLYRSWNNAVRIAFKLPNTTHTYLIEDISNSLHPKVMLSSRFVRFLKTCQSSHKQIVCLLSNLNHEDKRTSVGKNVSGIEKSCKSSFKSLSPQIVKKVMKYRDIPENEHWRTSLIFDLLEARQGNCEILLEPEELLEVLNFACSS